ncbi:hypothetical protein M3Y96_00587200 [Aphelenchoides besseyi]|nr:hypothetical protein M3Y96_00587200 [Aphelenchoides besseyi]
MHIVYYEGFEQSDNETGRSEPQHLPVPGFMPIPTGFAASDPLASEDERSKESLVLMELIKRPQFLYYDYITLYSKFASLPASIWVNSANCALLIIRSDSSEWTGTVDLDEPVCRFTLSDRSGYFLVFAKPGAQHLAQQFGQFTTNFVSFGTFMQRVNEMDFRSALIIANGLDQATIRHLKSPRFLVP